MKNIQTVLFLLLFVVLLCSGCSPLISQNDSQYMSLKEMIVKVAPHKVECHGLVPMKCLVVDGEYFYSPIQGFDFTDGYNYTLKLLRVQRYTAETTPMDVGLYEYQLVEIIDKSK